jgi:N-acyl-phosphatidylethanolamine-hydrolysing phospholipase D
MIRCLRHASWLPGLFLLVSLEAGCGSVESSQPERSSHRLGEEFRNTNPEFSPPKFWDRLAFMASRIWTTTFHPRSVKLPLAESNRDLLKTDRTMATVTWVGHSTLLIQLDGVTILTDPQWSSRASPVTFAGPKRVMPPGLSFEQLPPIDLVLISHDHYDHLDLATVKRLAETHRPVFLVPLGLKAWFADQGIVDVIAIGVSGVPGPWLGRRSACSLLGTPVTTASSRKLEKSSDRLTLQQFRSAPICRLRSCG